MPINVVIADDHKMVREGIRQLLEFDGKIKVIGEAGNGLECLELLKKDLPNVLLLDINMPEMNGLDVLQHIRKNKIKVKVIILTVHNEIEYLLKANDLNVDGYILKDSESEILKNAIYSVNNGENYIQPELIPLLNSTMIHKDIDKEKIDSLTKREVEVLKSISAGVLIKKLQSILVSVKELLKTIYLISLKKLMLLIEHRPQYLLLKIIL